MKKRNSYYWLALIFLVGVFICVTQGAASVGPILIFISIIVLMIKLSAALARRIEQDAKREIESARTSHIRPDENRMEADIVLVACVKSKRSETAKAKDLYTSTLFRKERNYAESTGLPWYILSAEYGLVDPEQEIAPYERNLGDESLKYRREWGAKVVSDLEQTAGNLSGKVIEIHAGVNYLQPLRSRLQEKGAIISEPLHGLTQGKRLQWYNNSSSRIHHEETAIPLRFSADMRSLLAKKSDEEAEEKIDGLESSSFTQTEMVAIAEGKSSPIEISALVVVLQDESQALSPTEIRAIGSGALDTPGLYSWWVDAEGARELTAGLGHPISPGLIYAGQAGATHWPSGKPSSNTLWLRIEKMHLGANHQLSTFRHTLGAILALAEGVDSIDERALTEWMLSHLRLIAVPFMDADSLGKVEEAILAELNPPLNLKGVPKNPVRSQITTLRRRVNT